MEGEKREELRRERWVPSMKSQPNHWRVSFLSLIPRPMARSSPETNCHVFIILSHFLHCPLYYCSNTCTSVVGNSPVNFTLEYIHTHTHIL